MRVPLFFDAGPRRLFGLFHARPAGMAPRRGVLLCNAFGREAIRAHRVYRVLAERLARAGCDVLRFDYSCSGDSAGEDIDANLDAWRDDVRAAHAELQRRAGVPRMTWFGMRLGALIAQHAARGGVSGLDRLVLWDPVIDGRDYLELLRVRHLEREAARPGAPPIETDVFRRQPDFYMDEAIGIPLSRMLCDQLRAARFETAAPVATQVISDPHTDDGRALAQQRGSMDGGMTLIELVHGTDWTSNRDASGLVPAPAMNLILDKAGSG
jgi:pimeloyl-ACP methyl ester carboxylesterase